MQIAQMRGFILVVAAVASAVARLWLEPPGTVMPDPPWFAAVRWQDFIVTLMIAGLGGALGFRLRIPAGGLLLDSQGSATSRG